MKVFVWGLLLLIASINIGFTEHSGRKAWIYKDKICVCKLKLLILNCHNIEVFYFQSCFFAFYIFEHDNLGGRQFHIQLQVVYSVCLPRNTHRMCCNRSSNHEAIWSVKVNKKTKVLNVNFKYVEFSASNFSKPKNNFIF